MPRKYLQIDRWTGQIVSEGDLSDIQKGDALTLLNLKPDLYGSLIIPHDIVELESLVEETLTAETLYRTFGYILRGGNVCVVYFSKNASSNYVLGAYYGSAYDSLSAITEKEHTVHNPTIYSKNIFFQDKNILRVGSPSNNINDDVPFYYPSAVVDNEGTPVIYTEEADGYGYSVIEPELWVHNTGFDVNYMETDGEYADIDEDENPDYTYGRHTVGLYIDETGISNGKMEEDEQVWYAVSFTYDNIQESPLEVCDRSFTITGSNTAINLRLFIGDGATEDYPGLDPRITAINIYRSFGSVTDISADDYIHIYSVQVEDLTDTAVLDNSGQTINWTGHENLKYADMYDTGAASIQSYFSRTECAQFNVCASPNPADITLTGQARQVNIKFSAKWNIGCIAKGRAIVSLLEQYHSGRSHKPEKTLAISQPGQYDVFLPERTITLGRSDGSAFIGLQPLGPDRLAVFDQNNAYIINIAQFDLINWFLEKTYNISINTGDNLIIAADSLVAITDAGLYYFSPLGEMSELSRRIRRSWNDATFTNANGFYDEKEQRLYIGNATSENGYGYVFNFRENIVMEWKDENSIVGDLNNLFIGLDSDIVLINCTNGTSENSYEDAKLALCDTGNYDIFDRKQASAIVEFKYESPWLDMGSATAKYRGKYVYVRYRLSDSLYLEGKNDVILTCTLENKDGETVSVTKDLDNGRVNGTTDVIKSSKMAIPYGFRRLKITIDTDGFMGKFELHELMIEYMEGRIK